MNPILLVFPVAALLALSRGEASESARSIPVEHQAAARHAGECFERGNYRGAERIYEDILASKPNNLHALSNLGVVRFRAGKLNLAVEAFRRAIDIAPSDAFSHCTLGVVYYAQGNMDKAVRSFTFALSIDSRNETAKKYLAIAKGQKGAVAML